MQSHFYHHVFHDCVNTLTQFDKSLIKSSLMQHIYAFCFFLSEYCIFKNIKLIFESAK